jgi:hypothetical protein
MLNIFTAAEGSKKCLCLHFTLQRCRAYLSIF